ncbi:Na+/H+ antiporter subunit G [Coraliomargarita sinensis]|uniref:Na+/H+ antiporter subunit G n=1 Tax=Coraliomargarita sinensis TaxID=2174842 RepID=A0A317ZKJ6_9BACT|nr:monovalent cation/H(+) antiporter subunit G [Coraliomargarita sinensis]PXA04743.1 Na+/H+ antiporter subunit G [Coraliomargarita sinensis]
MSWIVAILLVTGAFFAFVAALGVHRFPDFYMRMHAATKAGAFGASLLLLSAALHFGTLRAAITSLLIIGFFYLTTPIAAQTIGQAAYRKKVPLWKKTCHDQLAEDEQTESPRSDS